MIAQEFGVRWVDLILYNFYTVNGLEINWYLRNFVGCTKHNGTWYEFTSHDNPGMILVPDIPAELQKPPAKCVDAIRDGKATLDSKLQIQVVEWVADGSEREISGKWLYVFSGGGSYDFGYAAPFKFGPSVHGEGPHSPLDEPGSAFTLDFPGVFPVKAEPDKLEYEIYISSEDGPSNALVNAVSGVDIKGEPSFKVGRNWHVLSDSKILQRALSKPRDTRTTHAYRNTKTLSIDLAPKGQPRRYYFLLSPFQLGPKALKYAMSHPQGLTPLLKPSGADQWNPNNPNGPDPTELPGLQPEDVRSACIKIKVIDPYAWVENIAEVVYADSISEYANWIKSRKNTTEEELRQETGWTIDHFYLAELLKAVRDSHAKPDEIDDEIKDVTKWKQFLERWQRQLVQRTAEITASAHRSLLQILEWLDGPAHKIIETTVLEDTMEDKPQNALDVGRAILHWAVCTEHLMALEPGVVYLRDVFAKPGTVSHDLVIKHFEDLEKDNVSITIEEPNLKGMRYANLGVLRLLALHEFVKEKPPIPAGGSREEYLMRLKDYTIKRRDNLIRVLNGLKVLPAEVVKTPASPPLSQGGGWSAGSVAFVALLDLADKWTTWIIDPQINIPHGKNAFLNKMADIEEWFGKRPSFAKVSNLGTSYALKGVASIVGGYNLYAAITTARFDYQNSVSMTEWFGVVSGATLAVQDVLAEIAVLTGSQGMGRLFPQLITSAGGPAWGVGASRVTGIVGGTFASTNVLMMFISGVVTVVSMYQGLTKAKSRGDYTAAGFYAVGVVGGFAMTTGAIVFGVALMEAGGAVSATGIGATVGVVLFALGGIVAGIAALCAWWGSSDEYEVFARKCFLGKHGSMEPRFGDEPPPWSHAEKQGSHTWPIVKQTRAIFNLLGRFSITAGKPSSARFDGKEYHDVLFFEIKPGVLPKRSTITMLVQYGDSEYDSSGAVFQWEGHSSTALTTLREKHFCSEKPVKIWNGKIFQERASEARALYYYKDNASNTKGKEMVLERIDVYLKPINYYADLGKLVASTKVKFPEPYGNIIVAKKFIMEGEKFWGLLGGELDPDEVVSAIFE